jgi:hypothetical protein
MAHEGAESAQDLRQAVKAEEMPWDIRERGIGEGRRNGKRATRLEGLAALATRCQSFVEGLVWNWWLASWDAEEAAEGRKSVQRQAADSRREKGAVDFEAVHSHTGGLVVEVEDYTGRQVVAASHNSVV